MRDHPLDALARSSERRCGMSKWGKCLGYTGTPCPNAEDTDLNAMNAARKYAKSASGVRKNNDTLIGKRRMKK